jgi:hypothetical protein
MVFIQLRCGCRRVLILIRGSTGPCTRLTGPPMADDHSGCRQVLIDMAADTGTEITVSVAPPDPGPYPAESYTCPHGIAYWIQPTQRQIAAWTRDGVE